MNFQTTSPAAPERPDPLTATLHNDKGERNEFSNTARDIVLNYQHNSRSAVPTGAGQAVENLVPGSYIQMLCWLLFISLEFHDTINYPLLTPPDGEYPVSATISLTLPRELVERILLLLDTKSILKSRLVNREFNAIIQSSTLVQYYLACTAAGVIDNPQSPLSYAERLEALKKREGGWRKLTPMFETTIKPIDQPSTLYELAGGSYFLTDEHRRDLYHCHLPSSPEDNPQWLRIPGHGPRQSWSGFILDMGMAVYEHDLVVNIISSEVENSDMHQHSLSLVLLKFSTGGYHPLAHCPHIHVQRSYSPQPYTIVRITGDNLVLVVYDEDGSKLFIFDWKTGHKRLQHKSIEDAYDGSYPVFVSPELLLVPNRILSHFEVWHLFPSHLNSDPPVQVLSLQIPAISVNYSIIDIRCHGEPSPFRHSMSYFPPRPFFHSSENSIIIVNLFLQSLPGFRETTYKLIMHRHRLLDMIQKWTSPSLLEQQEGLTWLTNEVTVHKVEDPDDGSVSLVAQSELVSTMLHPESCDSPTLATSQIFPTSPTSTASSPSSIFSGSASFTSRYNILQVQWADWGPPISRWLLGKETRTWINQSTGQRCVFLDHHPRDKTKYLVAVADFNLPNIRRNAEMAQLRGEGEGNGNNGEGKKEEKEDELEILNHEGVFSEEVYMGLKCVVHHAPGEYDFHGVVMDEERLLGLKVDSEGREKSIKVLYFG
ncbi:hypothetical protein M378DRAFT_158394 [Amanita muscaria Koide BX008]|uniref:F-box domain-containing protein n=1 Tax=Amanita muscaria (strain Koide BX008) TaxID=946122 RepID=A0A0C2XGM3_AMAMK|nr:hypothetical protein M378DRAFT_158394 [Amanita muscaria Koide BX008]